MPTANENLCCQDYRKIRARMEVNPDHAGSMTALLEPIQCICQHPAFEVVVLNPWNLEMVASDYVREEGRVGDEVSHSRLVALGYNLKIFLLRPNKTIVLCPVP